MFSVQCLVSMIQCSVFSFQCSIFCVGVYFVVTAYKIQSSVLVKSVLCIFEETRLHLTLGVNRGCKHSEFHGLSIHQCLRYLVSSILTTKIGCNVFVSSYCERLKHITWDFLDFLELSIKNILNTFPTSLACWT